MGDLRREILLGYLCGALEDSETELVENELGRNEIFRLELSSIRKEVEPLDFYARATEKSVLPPRRLAERTCASLWRKIDNGTIDEFEIKDFEDSDFESEHPLERGPLSLVPVYQDTQLEEDRESPRIPKRQSSNILRRIYGERRASRLLGKRKSFPIHALLVSVISVVFVFLIPTVFYVKDEIVRMYTAKYMKKLSDQATVASQLYGSSMMQEYLESKDLYQPYHSGTDVGTFFGAFTQVDLLPSTLNYSRENSLVYGSHSNSQDNPYSITQVNFGYPAQKNSGFYPLSYPQSFVPHSNPSPPQKNPGFTFADWNQIAVPVLKDVSEESEKGAFFEENPDQGVIYRDGRVFFRKLPTK